MPSPYDMKFLRAVGFGKDEASWITQYDSWPIREGFRSKYVLVGRGPPRSSFCGKHKAWWKCDEVDLHTGEFAGKDIWHNQVMGCHSPSCCVCFKYDWAVLEANRIESRFFTAQDKLGIPVTSIEHCIGSTPKRDYKSSFDAMCLKATSAFVVSGATGGVIIFHSHRKDLKRRDLYFSPHFHGLVVLGGIHGGYSRCRSCVKVGCCWDCDGFEGVTRRAHVDDGWIVSMAKNSKGVVETRKVLFGTAWYQLEHSGLQRGVKNFRNVRWFGSLANCKLKTVVRPVRVRCAVCKSEMHLDYPIGVEPVISNRGEKGFVKNFYSDHVEGDVVG